MAKPAEPKHPMCFCYCNGFLLGLQVLLQTPIKYLKCTLFSSSSGFFSFCLCSLHLLNECRSTSAQAHAFLSGRPLAQHHNAYGSLVPWLSFDVVIRSCRSRSSNLFYCYLVSLRSVCHCETLNKNLFAQTSTPEVLIHTLAVWYPVETLTSLYYASSSQMQWPQSQLMRLSVPERNRTPFDTTCFGASAVCWPALISAQTLWRRGLALSSRSDPQSPPNPPIPPYWQLWVWESLCVCVCV